MDSFLVSADTILYIIFVIALIIMIITFWITFRGKY